MKPKKPKLPKGYRFLKDGKSKNKDEDLVWGTITVLSEGWISVKTLVILPGSPLAIGKTYYEPKIQDTWNAFRCRKKK